MSEMSINWREGSNPADIKARSEELALESQILRRNTKRSLEKDDFLQLFITQLIHQNPMEPLNNDQFISQMAQFTAIEQATNTASTVAKMLSAQEETNEILSMMFFHQAGSASRLMYETSSLIGRNVVAAIGSETPVSGRVVRVVLNEGAVEVHLHTGRIFGVADILEIAE